MSIKEKQISFVILSFAALLFTSTTIFNNNISSGNAEQEEKKQIFISSDNIKKVDSIGDYKGEKHVKFFTPNRLVDNLTNTYSFWSQNGNSSFSIELKNPLTSPICSLEIGVSEPELKTPFTIKVSNSSAFKQANGILDQANKKATIDKCLTNVNKIDMSFKPTSDVIEDRWTILSEIKLFTDKTVIIPPVDPPICKDGEHLENGVCVPDIIIEPPVDPEPPTNNVNGSITNSNITLNVSNSTVTINADAASSIITPTQIPETIVPTTSDPNDKSDEKEEEQEREEQEEAEEADDNDDDDDNEKDSKKDKNGDDN